MGMFDTLFRRTDWTDVWVKKTEGRLYNIIENADKGDPRAKAELSVLFREGLTNAQLNELRRKIYAAKAMQGDPNAEYWLGFLCDMIDHDKENAFKWYQRAAEKGNTIAMRALALRYSEFVNSPEMGRSYVVTFGYDKEKEWYWTEKAANLGDKKAQLDIGNLCSLDGKIAEAIEWYTMASDSLDCDIRIKAWRGLVDLYDDILYPEHMNEEKKEEVLIKLLCCKQESEHDIKAYDEYEYEYTRTAFSLGLLYYNRFQKEQNMDVAWKAAYCLSLAMIRGNVTAVEFTSTLPVTIPRNCWDEWCYDARNLLYNPRW